MNRIVILGISIFLVLLLGCRGESRSDNGETNGHKNLTKTDTITSLSNQPIKIKFYLENSHSMGGYYGHRSRFYDKVDGILSDFIRDKKHFELVCHTVADSIEKYATPNDFRVALDPTSPTKIAIGKSSPLDKILSNVSANTRDDLSILITDGIISGSNKQIDGMRKTGRHYNIEFIPNLKNDIKIGLGAYSEKYDTKVIAFKSDFEASKSNPYYKLDNGKVTKGIFTNRPYYIILIGKPEIIKEFEKRYKKLKSNHSLEFGYLKNNNNIVNLSRFANTNNCSVRGNKLSFKENKKSFRFSLLINLEDFPKAYNNSEFLTDNLFLISNGDTLNNFGVINIYELGDSPEGTFKKDSRVNKELSGNTHVVIVEVNDFNIFSPNGLELVIQKEYAPWYKEWSSMNDLNITFDDDKTFGLEYFIQGIIDAYGGREEPIFQHNIKIETN